MLCHESWLSMCGGGARIILLLPSCVAGIVEDSSFQPWTVEVCCMFL